MSVMKMNEGPAMKTPREKEQTLLVIIFTELGQLVLVCMTARCLCNSRPRVNICRRRARAGGRARARVRWVARCSISN